MVAFLPNTVARERNFLLSIAK